MRKFNDFKALAVVMALVAISLGTTVVIAGVPRRTMVAVDAPRATEGIKTQSALPQASIANGTVIDHNAADASAIPQAWLDQARVLDTFFTHKSIGSNILDGIADLQAQDPVRYSINVIYGTGSGAGITHYQVGSNGDPQSKIDGFDHVIRTEPAHDVAFMKFCVGDFPPFANVSPDDVWEPYRDVMEGLQADYPDTVFVWWTVPLTTQSDNRGNAEKTAYNALVRAYVEENGGVLFDIADIESHDPSGNPVIGPTGYEAMYDGYSSDGAHLNEAGRQRIANALWWLLARMADWPATSHWISVSPDHNEASVYPGETATYHLAVTASEGFSQPITLALQGAPGGTSVSFDPNPVVAPGGSQLHVTTTAVTGAGVYAMTATGTAGEISAETPLTLTVRPVFSLMARPFFRTALPGEVVTYSLSVTADAGFATPVTFTLHGEPANVHVAFQPDSVVPPATSQLYITTTTATEAGIYDMMVTGASGTFTDTANLTLVAASEAPSFTLGVSPDIRIARPNQVVSYTALVTEVNGLSGPVNLTVIGLPVGVGATWSANPVMPGDSSVLSLAISGDPLFGNHKLEVVGTAAGTGGIQMVTQGVELVIEHPYKLFLPLLLR